MADRFFLAILLGGRLHPNGIPEWGPWEASRLHWWPEDHLDLVLTTTRERKVRTTEELDAAIKEPHSHHEHPLFTLLAILATTAMPLVICGGGGGRC